MGKGSSNTTQYTSRPLTDAENRIENSYANYATAIEPSAYNLYNTATDRLTGANNVNPDYNGLYQQQAAATANNAQTANNIAGGFLPQSYADNRNAQAQRYAQASVGDLLSSLGSRGIINSSVMNSGLNGINQNLANTFQNSYNQDLQTASNLNNNAQNFADMGISNANKAQQASYQLPLQLYGASQGQMQPQANIYQGATASQNMNGTQTTSQSGSGLFGTLASLGKAYIGAGGTF